MHFDNRTTRIRRFFILRKRGFLSTETEETTMLFLWQFSIVRLLWRRYLSVFEASQEQEITFDYGECCRYVVVRYKMGGVIVCSKMSTCCWFNFSYLLCLLWKYCITDFLSLLASKDKAEESGQTSCWRTSGCRCWPKWQQNRR